MFKKMISIVMVMVVMIGCTISASAVCASEDGRPGIIGIEYYDAVMEIDELYNNDEIEIPYCIEMQHANDIWVVYLTGCDAYSDYEAFGIYDHAPTSEDFEILWANRLTSDELNELLNSLEEGL